MRQKESPQKSRTQKATLVHQLNAQRRANTRLARSRGQILQRMAALSTPSSPKAPPTTTRKTAFDLEQDRRRAAILENMTANSRVAESRRRYTYTVLAFAMIIATISLTSYKMLRNYLYLPSPSLLSRYFRNDIKHIKDLITSREQLGPALDLLSEQLSEKMVKDFGQGFDPTTLRKMRQFYLAFPDHDVLRRELSWTHYRRTIRIKDDKARIFYMNECANGQWSTRQLARQINSMFYERLITSKDKEGVSKEIYSFPLNSIICNLVQLRCCKYSCLCASLRAFAFFFTFDHQSLMADKNFLISIILLF